MVGFVLGDEGRGLQTDGFCGSWVLQVPCTEEWMPGRRILGTDGESLVLLDGSAKSTPFFVTESLRK